MDVEPVTASEPTTLREQLEQVRDVLWGRLSTPGMRADALAPVAKAYMEACMRLDALPNDAGGSVTDDLQDELAALRAKRPAGPAAVGRGEDAAGL